MEYSIFAIVFGIMMGLWLNQRLPMTKNICKYCKKLQGTWRMWEDSEEMTFMCEDCRQTIHKPRV